MRSAGKRLWWSRQRSWLWSWQWSWPGSWPWSWLLAAVILWAGASAAVAEKRIALVIGNDRYANLTGLQKAANDADAVGDALARLGFEVIRGRDLGRQATIDKLAEFTARVEAGDVAVFFFAGHGVAIGGVNYLVPVDAPVATAGAEARIRGASISEPDVTAEIQAKGARLALLVLDACRDNPFPRQGTRTLGNTRGLADPKPVRGVFTIYSAGIGQTALDRLERNDPHRNSVFTRIFVDALTKPGLHLGELAVEVREQVAALALKAKSDQGEPAPHEQTPAYYDQTIGGRVYLAGRPPAAAPPPPDIRAGLAERLWASVKDTDSPAVLEFIIGEYGDTPFAALARARLNELRQARTSPPAASPPVARPPAASVPAAIPAVQTPPPAAPAPRPPASNALRSTFVGGAGDCDYVCSQDPACRSTRYDAPSKRCELLATGTAAVQPRPAAPPATVPPPRGPAADVLATTFVGSAGDCSYLCSRNAACGTTRYDAASKTCELLRGSPTRTTAAPAPGQGSTFVGSDADCAGVCARNSGCNGYSWDPATKLCRYALPR